MNDASSFYSHFKEDLKKEELNFFCLLSPSELDFAKGYYEYLIIQHMELPDKQFMLENKLLLIEHIANYKSEVITPSGSLMYTAYPDETLEHIEILNMTHSFKEDDFKNMILSFKNLSLRHESVKNYCDLLSSLTSRVANSRFKHIPILPLKVGNNTEAKPEIPLLIKNKIKTIITENEDISLLKHFSMIKKHKVSPH